MGWSGLSTSVHGGQRFHRIHVGSGRCLSWVETRKVVVKRYNLWTDKGGWVGKFPSHSAACREADRLGLVGWYVTYVP